MHFAFAITEYFPIGGAQRDFIAVATAMAKRGHKISVITTAWQGEQDPSWQYFILDHNEKTNHGQLQALSNYVLELKTKNGFDAVIGFTKMTGLDIYFAADNCFRATKYKGLNKLLPRYRTYANIESSLFANQNLNVFYLTEIQQRQYQSCFKLDDAKSVILPVCVDDSFRYDKQAWLTARTWRQSQLSDNNRIALLFVAADFKTKGLDRIIDAFSLLDKEQQARFSLWIVGTGKSSQYQKKLDQMVNIEYHFFGGQSELRQFYLAADYLVHPARKEAAGMVLAEAMAARLPLCVTDCCGYAFLAKDDPESVLLKQDDVISQLATFLKNTVTKSAVPDRGNGSEQVLNVSRAEFCADKIEAWVNE